MATSPSHRAGFGHRLKVLRVQRDLRQRDLADRLGLSPSYVSLFETDDRTPTPEQVSKLCRVLGVSPSDLDGDAA